MPRSTRTAGPARDAAVEALACAEATGRPEEYLHAHAYLAWVADLAGDTAEAERQFTPADQILHADDLDGDHLYSGYGAAGRSGCPAPGGPARPGN